MNFQTQRFEQNTIFDKKQLKFGILLLEMNHLFRVDLLFYLKRLFIELT